jgi:hypothetical protein
MVIRLDMSLLTQTGPDSFLAPARAGIPVARLHFFEEDSGNG